MPGGRLSKVTVIGPVFARTFLVASFWLPLRNLLGVAYSPTKTLPWALWSPSIVTMMRAADAGPAIKINAKPNERNKLRQCIPEIFPSKEDTCPPIAAWTPGWIAGRPRRCLGPDDVDQKTICIIVAMPGRRDDNPVATGNSSPCHRAIRRDFARNATLLIAVNILRLRG